MYGIDLSDLPLEKLTEQKRKKLRGKKTAISTHSSYSERKSFSRGWSRYDKEEADPKQNNPESTADAQNVRDFVALLPRSTSVSVVNAQESRKESFVSSRSDSCMAGSNAALLPDVTKTGPGMCLL